MSAYDLAVAAARDADSRAKLAEENARAMRAIADAAEARAESWRQMESRDESSVA